MSSDYISRLRAELLRAGAMQPAPRRRRRAALRLRPLVAAATAAGVALAVLVALLLVLPADRGDERPAQQPEGTVELSYRIEPAGAAKAQQTADVLRERLATAGIAQARVSVDSSFRLTITAPAGARADVTALTQPGRLAVYDWEGSVLGPRGTPAPADPSVTGGADAGRAGISRSEAQARVARASAGRVVRAEGGGERWFALGGAPALTDADIARAEPAVDDATQEPAVALELTTRGQAAFRTLTRELANRGSRWAEPDRSDVEAFQHLAIVIDDRIVSTPYIDFRTAPDGLDGSAGVQISGDLTPQAARQLAIIVTTGPLPAALSAAR